MLLLDLGKPPGEPGSGAGAAVAAGDVDGDGADDLVVGARTAPGTVYVEYGPLEGRAGLAGADVRWDGEAPGDRAGAALGVGAVGRSDLARVLVGAPGERTGGVIEAASELDLTAGAAYVVGAESLTVTPGSGPVGRPVRIDGRGWDGRQAVEVRIGGQVVARVPADGDAWRDDHRFRVTAAVPDLPAGPVPVEADSPDGPGASTTFTVEATVAVNPDRGGVDDLVTVTGTGWAEGEPILWFGDAPADLVEPVTRSGGTFRAVLRVPDVPAGGYPVGACLDCGYASQATSVTFRVDPRIVLDPPSGPVGTRVTVTGSGWAIPTGGEGPERPLVALSFGADPAVVLSPPQFDGTRTSRFTATIEVPDVVPETYTVRATQAELEATADFLVPARVTVDPDVAAVDEVVTLTGEGWDPGEPLEVALMQESVTVVPDVALGPVRFDGRDFTTTLTVPDVPGGAYEVEVAQGPARQRADLAVRPSVAVDPTSGGVGDVVTVTGAGWGRGDVDLAIGGIPLVPQGPPERVGRSRFSARVGVPDLPSGTYDVTATQSCGSECERRATVSFTVAPRILLDPVAGPPGTSVTVTGSGFDPESATVLSVDGVPLAPATGPTWSGASRFTLTFTLPDRAAGTVAVAVEQDDRRAEAPFLVLAGAAVDPGEAAVDDVVALTGAGWVGEAPLAVALLEGSRTVVADVPLGPVAWNGSAFATTFAVPDVPAGPYDVRVRQPSAQLETTTALAVVASVAVDPTRGGVDDEVAVTGAGWDPDDPLTLTFDGEPAELVAGPDRTGASRFTATVRVPDRTAGVYEVAVCQRCGDEGEVAATARFIVAERLVLDPVEGPPGTAVAVTGTGFAPAPAPPPVLRFDGETATVLTAPERTGVSRFTATIVVPPRTAGTYAVTAEQEPARLGAAAPFEVVPAVAVDPDEAEVDERVALTGAGWFADEPLVVALERGGTPVADDLALEPVVWSDGSAFASAFAVPDLPAETYTVVVRQPTTELEARTTLAVRPSLDADPDAGEVDSLVVLRGAGWLADEPLALTFGGQPVIPEGPVRRTGASRVEVAVRVPELRALTYLVGACQRCDGAAPVAATTAFTVRPSLVVDPVAGAVGRAVAVRGVGWHRDAELRLTFNGTEVGVLAAEGPAWEGVTRFTATITVPDRPGGSYPVRGCQFCADGDAALEDEATFLVVPALRLDPPTGPVGQAITVEGSGWRPGEPVDVVFDPLDPEPPIAVTADAGGRFRTVVVAPERRAGTYDVAGCQACGEPADEQRAVAPFGLLPLLTVDPAAAPVGAEVTVSGIGWLRERPLELLLDGEPLAVVAAEGPEWTGDTRVVVTVRVPDATMGAHPLRGCQPCGDVEALTSLAVRPSLELARGLGPPGFVTTATGTGFPAGEVTLRWAPGIGRIRARADDRGRLRAPVLVFPRDLEGRRELLVDAPADPELAALRTPFLVVAGSAEPGGYVERD